MTYTFIEHGGWAWFLLGMAFAQPAYQWGYGRGLDWAAREKL